MSSVVKSNLLADKNYTPYCGGDNCKEMPRTMSVGICEFVCLDCGWKSSFDESFKEAYKLKHGIVGGMK